MNEIVRERKLATIRRIKEILPIENADSLELAIVDGWKVVVRKNEFEVDDLVIYFEIDSWVPHNLAPFLSKGKEPRVYNGVEGERLKTVKLRGQISQGLILPIDQGTIEMFLTITNGASPEGFDLTEQLNVQKWEREIPANMRGTIKGNFPSFLRKTDAERIQNLSDELKEFNYNRNSFVVTEKLDGTSFTCYYNNGEFGVCSRNLELKEDDDSNLYWQIAKKHNLRDKLNAIGRNLAIQGEIIGEGIQKNYYKMKDQYLYIFSVYDIDNGEYLPWDDVVNFAHALGPYHVPYINEVTFEDKTIDSILEGAEGKSNINHDIEREGIVFFSSNLQTNFKAISNKWLLKNE